MARVSVIIGRIGRSSRTNVRVENADFQFNEEGFYQELCASVEERVVAALNTFEGKTLRPDGNVYAKPSLGATQKDFVALTEANWRDVVDLARLNYQRRRKADGPLRFELFVFAIKDIKATETIRRRATRSRIQQAAEDIGEFLTERTDVHVVEIARTHWAMTQARQPAGAPVVLPESATFREMQHLDAVGAANPPDDLSEELHCTMAVRINGSSELLLTFNVQELRSILGLPSHNALGAGIFSSFEPPPEPEEDMEDVDHLDD